MIKKVVSMYFSPTHTSEKIVKAVSKKVVSALNAEYVDMNITHISQRKEPKSFSEHELLILALPVYSGRIPEAIEEYVQSLKGENTPAVVISVYGNRDFDDALLEMKNILSGKSFNVIAAGAFIGEHSFTDKVGTSRPDSDDMAIAAEFGVKIAEKVKMINDGKVLGDFSVKGNYPYKDRSPSGGITPITSEICISCGVCVAVCPTGAISGESPNLTDAQKCIRCAACVKVCPLSARSFKETPINNAIMWLEGSCVERREPELFL